MVKLSRKDQIIRITCEGIITAEQIPEIWESISKEDGKERVKVLFDIRKGHFDFDENNIDNIVKTTSPFWKKRSKVYEALIVDSPFETAMVTLIDKKRNKESHKIKIFITELSAVNWLESIP